MPFAHDFNRIRSSFNVWGLVVLILFAGICFWLGYAMVERNAAERAEKRRVAELQAAGCKIVAVRGSPPAALDVYACPDGREEIARGLGNE